VNEESLPINETIFDQVFQAISSKEIFIFEKSLEISFCCIDIFVFPPNLVILPSHH
jgi:hypothetical protein